MVRKRILGGCLPWWEREVWEDVYHGEKEKFRRMSIMVRKRSSEGFPSR